MKIAIDARMIEMSGIGSYIRTLLNQGIYEVALGNPKDISKYDKTVSVIEYEDKIYSVSEQLHFPSRALRKQKVELLHVPHYNVPVFYRGKLAVTIHDLTHLVLPEFLPNRFAYLYAKIIIGYAVRKAKVIFTDSENSKNDILRFFKVRPDKIIVEYVALNKGFVHKEKQDVLYLLKKYGISEGKKVIMYVGNLKPHKNLIRLLHAYCKMKDREATCLVLVGKAFDNRELDVEIAKLGIEAQVVKTGIVDREDLVNFYNLADLFVFPSLYEGFGLPPLEAMSCGTPVVCSNNSSLPEVVGDAAFTFDPYDESAIRNAMERVLFDEELAAGLVKKGYERVKKFDGSDIIERTKAAFDNIKR